MNLQRRIMFRIKGENNGDRTRQQQLELFDQFTTGSNSAVYSGATSSSRTRLRTANGESLQAMSELMPNCNSATSFPSKIPNKLSHHFKTSKFQNRNRSMNKRKTSECNICGYNPTRAKQLDEHTKTVHGKYGCTLYNETLKYLNGLRQHSIHHLPQKPFHCVMCTKSFSCRDELVKHMVCEHNITEVHTELYIKSGAKQARSLELLRNFHAHKSIQFDNAKTLTSSTLTPLSYPITLSNNIAITSSIKQFDQNPQQLLLINFVKQEETEHSEEEIDVETYKFKC